MENTETLVRTDQIIADLQPKKFGLLGKAWVALLVLILIVGLYAYTRQLRFGLGVTAMRDYSIWGIYISNFVFFVAISLVGSLVSAILKLAKVSWSTPLTRIAEIIAVASIIFAAISIVVDMGRPDRIFNVIFKARLQSPITWDVIVIGTYLVISILLLYLPMLPDLALLRDRVTNIPKWRARMYKWLSINWQGTREQIAIQKRAIYILAVLIIPVAFGIHTVTSWLFATTLRPGWDSTNFGPYFVSGAFMVGAAAVIAAMYMLSTFNKLGNYITDKHFDYMSRLLVLLSLLYLYFNINEYFIPAYKMKALESEHINSLFTGEYSWLFWTVQIFGMVVPIVVLMFRKGRKPMPAFIISIMVIVGAWLKRFLIVVPTLSHHFIPIDRAPESWKHYSPTWEEWSITIATLAGALLIITFLVRYFPTIPISETIEEQEESLPKAKAN